MSSIALAPGYARPARARRTSATAGPAGQPTDVRLTRRGRLLVLAVFVGLAFVVFTVLGGYSAATGEAGDPVQTRTVVVDEGDTLWAIASGAAAPGETQAMIHQIVELNALESVSLVEGQELAVPVG